MEVCTPDTATQIAPIIAVFIVLFTILGALIATGVMVLLLCKIFSKAGYNWALGLLMLVPMANIIMLFVLAFSNWPIRKELQLLRQQQANSADEPPKQD